jgi:hypothetical protein
MRNAHSTVSNDEKASTHGLGRCHRHKRKSTASTALAVYSISMTTSNAALSRTDFAIQNLQRGPIRTDGSVLKGAAWGLFFSLPFWALAAWEFRGWLLSIAHRMAAVVLQ